MHLFLIKKIECKCKNALIIVNGDFQADLLGESVQDTAKREVYEETGLILEEMELFGIYSGPQYDKTFSNGDQVSLVLITFICNRYSGELVDSNEESLQNKFYSLNELPENIFTEHKMLIDDLLSKKQLPIIG